MISVLGYNFLSDKNSIDPYPVVGKNVNRVQLQNCDYIDVEITGDISPINVTDTSLKTHDDIKWGIDTVFLADFNDNLEAGNISQFSTAIEKIRVKRRIKGTFDWITIKEITFESPDDYSFSFIDTGLANDEIYEYAFVPIVGGVEGDYAINEILSKFRGIFICDVDTAYQIYAGMSQGVTTTTQQVGVFTPYGRQYPIIVSNGLTNYQSGSVSGMITDKNFNDTGIINRKSITDREKVMRAMLTNKKPKILKTEDGDLWLCYITTAPSIGHDNVGVGIKTIEFGWTEIGNPNDKHDLYRAGMIPTEE